MLLPPAENVAVLSLSLLKEDNNLRFDNESVFCMEYKNVKNYRQIITWPFLDQKDIYVLKYKLYNIHECENVP